LEYSIVQHHKTGRLIVAKDLVPALQAKLSLQQDFQTLAVVKGDQLTGTIYRHSLYSRISPVLEGGDYISTDSGTGLVHTDPGHEQEDYLTGLKSGLHLLSPIDDDGIFTPEAGERFHGLNVLTDGNIEVINALNETNALLRVENYISIPMIGGPRSPLFLGLPISGSLV